MFPLSAHTVPARRAVGDGVVAAAVFAATFLLRWITLSFDNDYFMHLAWAAQMWRGELPVRDFVEPGFILQTLLAYVGFVIGGNQLIVEGLIVSGFVGGGAALVYLTVRKSGCGNVLALSAAAIAVLAYPRAYAYPKVFLYPAAAWAIAAHARAPAKRTQIALAVVTGVAFLFRHDHALWIGTACGIALLIEYKASLRQFVAAVALCTGVALTIAAPWLCWVAFSGHALAFVDNLVTAQSAVMSWHAPNVPIQVERSASLIAIDPVDYPRIAVRWTPSLAVDERIKKEQRFGLEPEPGVNGRYRLTNISASNISALLADPSVEDTNDVDRGRQTLRGGRLVTGWVRVQEYLPIVRLRLFPGVLRPSNALALLNWLTFAVPLVALLVALVTRAKQQIPQSSNWPTSVLGAVVFLGIGAYHGLVRGSPDSRLGDVASLTGILLAYLAARSWAVRGRTRLMMRAFAALLVGTVIVIATWYGRAYGRLSEVDLATLAELDARIATTNAAYRRPPRTTYVGDNATGLDRLARWLYECTDETSHIVVVGFEPQVFALAERPFGAGLSFLYEGWSSSERNQQLANERWSRQRVPVVIAVDASWEEFSRDYPLLRRRIDEQYQVAARSLFDGNKPLTVFVDRTASSVRTDSQTNLPCYR